MKYFALIPLTLLTMNMSFAQENLQNMNELDWMVGKWHGSNFNLKLDGSGEYDSANNLTIKIYKILGGYGYCADWYGNDSSYGGTTVRTFDVQNGTWQEMWFNPKNSNWEDQHKLKWIDNKLIMESNNQQDSFGKFSVKKVHYYDEQAKSYTYEHYRKYTNIKEWILINSFKIYKVD